MESISQPPITVSERDLGRLESLVESPRWQHLPVVKALSAELERAQVIADADIGPDLVTMNSTLTCVEEVSGREHTLTLCWPDEADAAKGKVSVLAPVGAALLGLSVGQRIDWPGPDGRSLRLRVASVTHSAA
ncbi:MAG: nucleoside diphosphate kinase regulator [Nevskiaceae bacterium]|jgi:regulator of nucleoside diphosphate kinase|nr:nucleoside diphosphate kinase regulator [Nevskiaceae bacterium]